MATANGSLSKHLMLCTDQFATLRGPVAAIYGRENGHKYHKAGRLKKGLDVESPSCWCKPGRIPVADQDGNSA